MNVERLDGAVWRKSSRSNGTGGNCVEVARNLPGAVAVRDSKGPGRPGPDLLVRRLAVIYRRSHAR